MQEVNIFKIFPNEILKDEGYIPNGFQELGRSVNGEREGCVKYTRQNVGPTAQRSQFLKGGWGIAIQLLLLQPMRGATAYHVLYSLLESPEQ